MTNQHLTCPDVLEKLPLYVGQDLDQETLVAVRAHLASCTDCRERGKVAADARGVFVGSLDDAFQECSRPGLWPGIRAGLIEEGMLPADQPEPLVRANRGAGRVLHRLVPLAAAAALLFSLGNFMGWIPPEGGAVPGIVDSSGAVAPVLTVAEDLAPSRDPFAANPLLSQPSGLRKMDWGDARLLDGTQGSGPNEWPVSTDPRLQPVLQQNELAGYR